MQLLETREILFETAAAFCLLIIDRTGTFKCALSQGSALTIGRDADCNVRVDDQGVSRHHARLRVGARIELTDLGSRNGTLIGDRRIASNVPVAISAGDAIRIGDIVLVVQATTAGAAALWFSDRAAFESRADEEIALAGRRSSNVALARVTIRPRGKEVAAMPMVLNRILSDALRPVDAFTELAAGDLEIVLPNVSAAAMGTIGARIREQLAELGCTAAIGSAFFPQDGSTQALLRAAAERRLVEVPLAELPSIEIDPRSLARVVPSLERISSGTINVLILGETGVGKEVVAHAIHDLSPRRRAALVCLNCCALSEGLLESELFGHERGAFTGAVRAKPGLLEAAHGGTLFLDEIGEMSVGLQAKFLRVLEQKEVTRVGAVTPRVIDVRILAATNRDLPTEIEAGRFRKDLYFRLSGMSMLVPPLRERLDEIEPLARMFVARASRLAKLPEPPISPEVISLLKSYPWPGNIRELRNVAERAVLLAAGEPIQIHHLPLEKMTPGLPTRAVSASPEVARPVAAPAPTMRNPTGGTAPPPPFSAIPPEGELDGLVRNTERERALIIEALRACRGNQTKAAEMLGMSRRTLVSRLSEYDLPRPRRPISRPRETLTLLPHRAERGEKERS